jgi:hypothetical protein
VKTAAVTAKNAQAAAPTTKAKRARLDAAPLRATSSEKSDACVMMMPDVGGKRANHTKFQIKVTLYPIFPDDSRFCERRISHERALLHWRKISKICRQRAHIPEHAAGWTDHLFARPVEFEGLPGARSARFCWIEWHADRLMAHDGLAQDRQCGSMRRAPMQDRMKQRSLGSYVVASPEAGIREIGLVIDFPGAGEGIRTLYP